MKTKQELDQIKQDYIDLANKLKELNDEELKQVTGGTGVYGQMFHPCIMLTSVKSDNNAAGIGSGNNQNILVKN